MNQKLSSDTTADFHSNKQITNRHALFDHLLQLATECDFTSHLKAWGVPQVLKFKGLAFINSLMRRRSEPCSVPVRSQV